jgi:peptide/nickel transport system substrate-binding protein
MKKLIAVLLSVILIASTFSACAKDEETSTTPEPTTSAGKDTNEPAPTEAAVATEAPTTTTDAANQTASQFPSAVVNDNPSIEGGILKVVLAAESAFAGVLNPCFYEDNYDAQILGWFTEYIISYDENFVADQDGVATYDYDSTAKTITLHMREGVKWHDGEPVTLDDLVYAYEVICHKDYQGLRYSESEMNVIGVEWYPRYHIRA